MPNPRKLIHGAALDYSLVPVNESKYSFSVFDKIKQICFDSVEGIIQSGKFYTILDNFQDPIDHWSLEIVSTYETDDPWLLINRRPGDLYHPMSYITCNLTYNVIEYDIWTTEDNDTQIAVVTEIDTT